MTKLASVKKKNLLELNDLGFLCYFNNPGLHRPIIQPLFNQNGNLFKEIFETLACCSRISLPRYLWYFGTRFLNWQS